MPRPHPTLKGTCHIISTHIIFPSHMRLHRKEEQLVGTPPHRESLKGVLAHRAEMQCSRAQPFWTPGHSPTGSSVGRKVWTG